MRNYKPDLKKVFFIHAEIQHINSDKGRRPVLQGGNKQKVKNTPGQSRQGLPSGMIHAGRGTFIHIIFQRRTRMKLKEFTEQENFKILITYKASVTAGQKIQDDYLMLSLVEEGKPEHMADAVINFPVMNGEKFLFIHDLTAETGEYAEIILKSAESFARKQSYPFLYINTSRLEMKFLRNHGFTECPGKCMARKELRDEP